MTLRDVLRTATRPCHERVDQWFGRFDLTQTSDYRAFLQAQFSVLPGCEAALTRGGAARWLPDWPSRQRAAALAADLATLGISPDETLPLSVTEPTCEAEAFGMLYVLEGSRLGGAVLARRVMASDDERLAAATQFLRHGEGRGLWPSFVRAMDAAPEVLAREDLVVASAVATFALFEQAAKPA